MKRSDHSSKNHSASERYEHAACDLFAQQRCSSCSLLDLTPGKRISTKLSLLESALSQQGLRPHTVDPIVLPNHPWHSRHKIKLAVSGTLEAPTIGIISGDGGGVDLVECPLAPTPIQQLLELVRELIQTARIPPYDISRRAGELKHVIITSTLDDSQGILRFVLRSSEAIPRIRKAVPRIQEAFPWVHVISCNIQPIPAAILEGPEEHIVSAKERTTETFGTLSLHFTPQSFMQVTPEVAAKLYELAAMHAQQLKPQRVLDLFCGVGGFSLHIAPHCVRIVGVELSSSAIDCARESAATAGFINTEFHAADVEQFLSSVQDMAPDMIIVNPPRRGLSEAIIAHMHTLAPRVVLYSSCNPETFARDVAALQPKYTLERVSPFDMFPLTNHCEVLGVLIETAHRQI